MPNDRAGECKPGNWPNTYREKYWGAIGSMVLVSGYMWVRTIETDPYAIYAIAALCLFMIGNLIATRIVLHPDRIESINFLGRRSLPREQVDRLEIRQSCVKGKTVETYVLVPRDKEYKPIMIPNNVRMDAAWFEWMAAIPEVKISADDQAKGAETAAIIFFVVFAFPVNLTLPLLKPHLKPYFDVFNLFVPWLTCLWVFSNRSFRDTRPNSLSEFRVVGRFFLGVPLCVASIYLVVSSLGADTYIVGSDSFKLEIASVAGSLLVLALLRLLQIDTLNMKRDWLVVLVGFAGFYGYGAASTANELFDTSAPQVSPVEIERKYILTGKRAGPYFQLAPWGPEARERSYRAPKKTYDRLMVSDNICAWLYEGAIGMRWYQLSDTCE